MSDQHVELHFREPPALNEVILQHRAGGLLGRPVLLRAAAIPADGGPSTIELQHTRPANATTAPGTKVLPARTMVISYAVQPKLDKLESVISQSWACPKATELLASSQAQLLVSELHQPDQSQPHGERLEQFHAVLRAILEQTKPIAMVFVHSQQVVDPAVYRESLNDAPQLRPGTINVRLFRISESNNDLLMDTRGLAALGLKDLQCHYRDLDPNAVSRVLFNTAIYQIEKGPVIESGHTIQGVRPGSRWTVQLEDSLAEPKRKVLDLDPGNPHAAGNRQRNATTEAPADSATEPESNG